MVNTNGIQVSDVMSPGEKDFHFEKEKDQYRGSLQNTDGASLPSKPQEPALDVAADLEPGVSDQPELYSRKLSGSDGKEATLVVPREDRSLSQPVHVHIDKQSVPQLELPSNDEVAS